MVGKQGLQFTHRSVEVEKTSFSASLYLVACCLYPYFSFSLNHINSLEPSFRFVLGILRLKNQEGMELISRFKTSAVSKNMGKKLSQASTKISKTDKKQLNSLIKVLRPKVYITDSSNFKRLVQELTGNGNPVSFLPPTIPEPVMQVPVIEIDDHAYQEQSLDSSVDSSEASMPTCFTPTESPELCVADTFNVFQSSLSSHEMDFPAYSDIESWLLETDNSFSYDCGVSIPPIQQEVGVYGYDLSDLII